MDHFHKLLLAAALAIFLCGLAIISGEADEQAMQICLEHHSEAVCHHELQQ